MGCSLILHGVRLVWGTASAKTEMSVSEKKKMASGESPRMEQELLNQLVSLIKVN